MYAAPETLSKHESYREPSDMWSIGIVTYTLIAGFFPFKDELGKGDLRRRILSNEVNRDPFPFFDP